MSRPHPLCLFSKVASRLSSSGVTSHDFYRIFCSACVVTVVICEHLHVNRSTYSTRAFSVTGPVCWNSLPDYLKSSDLSFNCFRQQLKHFLFCKHWHQSQHYFSALETLLMRSTNPWYLLTYTLLILTYLLNNEHIYRVGSLRSRTVADRSYSSQSEHLLGRYATSGGGCVSVDIGGRLSHSA